MRCFNKRREPAATAALAAILLLAGACGGKSGGAPKDAASDAPSDGGAPGCDPAAQICGAARKCDFECQGGVAVVDCIQNIDGGAVGSACAPAMPCAAGGGCVTMTDGGSLCRKYCASDGDCASGQRCHNDSVSIMCGTAPTVLLLHLCY